MGETTGVSLQSSEVTAFKYAKVQQQVVSALLQSLVTSQKNMLDVLAQMLQQQGIGNSVDVFA